MFGKWRLFIVFIFVAVFFSFSEGLARAQFAGGIGSSGSPYQITDCTQLQDIGTSLSSYYILSQNIDCSGTTTWNVDTGSTYFGFNPISGFTGNLDGQNYVISGLYINRPLVTNVGLFADINSGAVVRNVGMTDVQIKGNDIVGGLVGENFGQIDNCYTAGMVTSYGNNAGGLVGKNTNGQITKSYSAVSVSGINYVGGLVGYNSAGRIENTYATGNVGGTLAVGGLVGWSIGQTNISSVINSYASGGVTGLNNIGGLVGYSSKSLIANSFAMGGLSFGAGATGVGGLIGLFEYDSGTTRTINTSSINNGWNALDGASYAVGRIVDVAGSMADTYAYAEYNVTDNTVFYASTHSIYNVGATVWDFTTPVWREWTTSYPAFRAQFTTPTSTPTEPRGLSGLAGDNLANLWWQRPSSDGGAPISDYQVEYKLSIGSSWSVFNDGVSAGTSAVVTGLINDLSYDFRVSAVNILGVGNTSATASFTPMSATYFTTISVSDVTSGNLTVPVVTAPYTCVTNYYVSKTGNDSNDGTSEGTAWLTVGHALVALKAINPVQGGTCVNVDAGTYIGGNNATGLGGSGDTSTGYLVFRSTTLHGAILQLTADEAVTYNGNNFRFDEGNFIVIDGFDLVGQTVPGAMDNGVATNSWGGPGSHIKIINNLIHDHGGPGIGAVHTDYLVVDGNIIYNNASTSMYEVSGISTWQAVASDTAPEFHNVIRNNIIFNNAEIETGYETHSDGNGIIIDDFRNTQSSSTYGVYDQKTLIENNLVVGNGGAGIHVFLSDNVTVRNNTVFNNCLDSIGLGTWRGNLNVVNGANNVFVNNISVVNVGLTNIFGGTNVALMDNSTNSSNINNIWINNLSYNGISGQPSVMVVGSSSVISEANDNKLGVNPFFVDTSSGDFSLQAGSLAIDTGSAAYGLVADDLKGYSRPYGLGVDMGAYEYDGTTPTPTPTDTPTPTPTSSPTPTPTPVVITVGSTNIGDLITGNVFVPAVGTSLVDTTKITMANETFINLETGSTHTTINLELNAEITRLDEQTFDANLISAENMTENQVSNFPTGFVPEAVMQWGIPGVTLIFSTPVSINMYAGTTYNGQTLNIFRSASTSSGWTAEGIVSPATCVVTDGYCQFSITQASYFTLASYQAPASPSNNSSSNSSSSNDSSSSNSNSCNDSAPIGNPDLFQIQVNKGKVKLFYTPTTVASGYAVIYGLKKGDERFGTFMPVVNSNKGVQNAEIKSLDPRLTYYFKVAALNGCNASAWSEWVPVKANRKTTIYKYKVIIKNKIKTLINKFL